MKKRKGKKKWFAALLTLCLLISLIPMNVFADGIIDDIVPGSNKYKLTYHTRISATASVKIKDADGNVLEEFIGKKSSDDFIEGNLSDKNVQDEITRIDDEIKAQYLSRENATIDSITGQMVFDHFESNEIDNFFDVHEYQVYEISYDITVPLSQAGDTVITAVDVGNVWKTLEAGKEVAYTGEVNPNSECADQMELVMEGWQENAIDGSSLRSTRHDKPKAGSEYYYFIELKAKDGYVFPKDMSSLTNVICDGNTYTSWGGISRDDGKTASIYFYDIAVTATDNTVNDTVIDNISITDATLSYNVGDTPKATAVVSGNTVATANCVVQSENLAECEQTESGLKETYRYWFSDEQYYPPIGGRFTSIEKGKVYAYCISLEAKNGRTFATPATGLSLSINGKQITAQEISVSEDGTLLVVRLSQNITPAEPSKTIDLIDITGVTTTFKVGDKPVFTGKVPEDAPYYIDHEAWTGWDDGITSSDYWNNRYGDHEGSWGKILTSFKKDTKYTYNIYIKLSQKGYDEGYIFNENTRLSINGKVMEWKAESTSLDRDGETIWFFNVMDFTPTETTVTDDTNKDTNGGTTNPTTTVTDNKNTRTTTAAPATTTQTKAKTIEKPSTKAATTPKTGDDNLILMWFAIMSVSAGCLTVHSVRRRRRSGR